MCAHAGTHAWAFLLRFICICVHISLEISVLSPQPPKPHLHFNYVNVCSKAWQALRHDKMEIRDLNWEIKAQSHMFSRDAKRDARPGVPHVQPCLFMLLNPAVGVAEGTWCNEGGGTGLFQEHRTRFNLSSNLMCSVAEMFFFFLSPYFKGLSRACTCRAVAAEERSSRLLSNFLRFINVNAKLALERPLSFFTMDNGCISDFSTKWQSLRRAQFGVEKCIFKKKKKKMN